MSTRYFMRELGKIIVKICFVFLFLNAIRRIALLFVPPNRKDAEGRMLLVQLDNIGDFVLATSALKYYKQLFADKKIFFLCDGRTKAIAAGFADVVIPIERKRFIYNPLYSIRILAKLRRIGFSTVIHHNTIPFSSLEYFPAFAMVGAPHVIGYEGERVFLDTAPASFYEFVVIKCVYLFVKRAFTRLIPGADGKAARKRYIMPEILHYVAIYEALAGKPAPDYSTTLERLDFGRVEEGNFRIGKPYAVLGIGAAVDYRRWPLDNFVRVAEFLEKHDIETVLVGSAAEKDLGEEFARQFPRAHNFIGKTSVLEAAYLIAHSFITISNETAFAHIAIALKKPTLVPLGGGHASRAGLYGYPDINKWVYDAEAPCWNDNWMCGKFLPPGIPAPCVASLKPETVIRELKDLVEYIRAHQGQIPKERFSVSYVPAQ